MHAEDCAHVLHFIDGLHFTVHSSALQFEFLFYYFQYQTGLFLNEAMTKFRHLSHENITQIKSNFTKYLLTIILVILTENSKEMKTQLKILLNGAGEESCFIILSCIALHGIFIAPPY